jgi:hypothetical protein
MIKKILFCAVWVVCSSAAEILLYQMEAGCLVVYAIGCVSGFVLAEMKQKSGSSIDDRNRMRNLNKREQNDN